MAKAKVELALNDEQWEAFVKLARRRQTRLRDVQAFVVTAGVACSRSAAARLWKRVREGYVGREVAPTAGALIDAVREVLGDELIRAELISIAAEGCSKHVRS